MPENVLLATVEALGGSIVGPKGKEGEILCRCPNTAAHANGDEHPSLGVNIDKDSFRCLACDLRGKSPVTMTMTCLGLEKTAAVKWLVEKGIIEEKKQTKRTIADFDWQGCRERLASSRSSMSVWDTRRVTAQALESAGVGLGKHRGADVFIFPMHDEKGAVVGRKARLVDPAAAPERWPRHGETPIKSLTWAGDRNGVMVVKRHGFSAKETVFVMEGESDFLAALSYDAQPGKRINALGLPGAESVGGAVQKVLVQVARSAPEFVVCADADEAGERFAKAVAKAVAPKPCRLWRPSPPFGDWGAMHQAKADPLSTLSEAEIIHLAPVPATVPPPQDSAPLEAWGLAKTIVAGRGGLYVGEEDPKWLCNFDMRVRETVTRLCVETTAGARSEYLVEIVPAMGEDIGLPRTVSISSDEWQRTDKLKGRIVDTFPLAQFSDMWAKRVDTLRAYAVSHAERSKLIREQTGWHRLNEKRAFMMPGVTIFEDGQVLEDSDVDLGMFEVTGLGHRMRVSEDPQAVIRAVLDLSRFALDEHVNASLLGMHLVTAMGSLLSRVGVSRPHLMIDGVTNSGKSYVAKAHGLVWWDGLIVGGGGSEVDLKNSHTPKAAELKAAMLKDALLLIDNFNPHSQEQNVSGWMQTFHAIADSSASTRLTQTRQMRGLARPQCSAMVTVEDVPQDYAAQNRFCLCVLSRALSSDEKIPRMLHLHEVQRQSRELNSLIPLLITHGIKMHGGLDKFVEAIRALTEEALRGVLTLPGRMADTAAALMAGLAITGRILADVAEGDLRGETTARFNELSEILSDHFEHGAENGMVMSESRDEIRFINILEAGIESGEICLVNWNDEDGVGKRPIIGTFRQPYKDAAESDEVCLIQSVSFNTARTLASKAGRRFAFSDRALKRDLEGRIKGIKMVHIPKINKKCRCLIFPLDAFPSLSKAIDRDRAFVD